MPIQTTYGFSNDALLPGMVTVMTHEEPVTGYAAAAIAFGLGLVYDNETSTDGRQKVKVPSGSVDVTFVGVAGFDHTRPLTGEVVSATTLTTTQDAQYAIGAPIKVIKKGRVKVYVEGAVNPETPVFLRHTVNGVGTALGYFRGDADTARAIDVSAFARFAGVTTGAGTVDLDLDVL